MKTADELKVLKEEVETERKNIRALTDDELEQVTGGSNWVSGNCPHCGAPYSEECNGYNTCKVCGLSLFTWI